MEKIVGFVSYESAHSAKMAIEHLNGFQADSSIFFFFYNVFRDFLFICFFLYFSFGPYSSLYVVVLRKKIKSAIKKRKW